MSEIDKMKIDLANDIISRLKYEIESTNFLGFPPMDYTGQLKNSWEAVRDGEDVVIGTRLLYAKIMDEGRLPGSMPPIKAIFPWVLQKIGGRNQKDILSKAFAVAKKIEKKGIEGRNYIRKTLFRMEIESRA